MRLENFGTYTHEGGFPEIFPTEIVCMAERKLKRMFNFFVGSWEVLGVETGSGMWLERFSYVIILSRYNCSLNE